MTAVASGSNGWAPITSASAALIPSSGVSLAASKQIGRGQFLTYDSSANVDLNDGATPNLISAGVAYPEVLSDSSSAAGAARSMAWWGFGSGCPSSSTSNDGFAVTDIGVPFWIADENTPGKLSNYSGSNRSLGGLVFGLDKLGNPVLWSGPVAQALARAVHAENNADAGLVAYAQDATATTDQGSATDPILIPRDKRHGRITSIEIIPSADLAATGTSDYRIITIYKINTLTNAVSAVVATFDSRTQALAKRTPTQFALTGTSALLDMLETDVLGYASLHTSSGATVPQSIIRANMKVQ